MVAPLRTWTIVMDTAFTDQLDQQVQYQEAVFNLKNTFINAGWTVSRSSDGATSGASDLWVDAGDIQFSNSGAAARSWITLAPPSGWLGAGETLELLIDCNNPNPDTTPQLVSIQAADQVYTGGTDQTPPTTAGLETTVITVGDNIIPWTSVETGRWTSWYSSRGDVMFGVKIQGTLQWRHFFMIHSNTNADGGGQGGNRWYMFARDSATAEILTSGNLNSTSSWRGWDAGAAALDNPEAHSTCWQVTTWTNGLNFNGETITSPIDVLQDVAVRGRAMGSLVDVYATPTTLTAGTLDDSETLQTQRRICFGDIMLFVTTASLPFA